MSVREVKIDIQYDLTKLKLDDKVDAAEVERGILGTAERFYAMQRLAQTSQMHYSTFQEVQRVVKRVAQLVLAVQVAPQIAQWMIHTAVNDLARRIVSWPFLQKSEASPAQKKE